ncbi:FAS1 domain [Sesbania bispinosa]|nr:FAS1 domain [Sesbania bispinosa]
MKMQQSLFSASLVLIITFFYTTSAQQSPVQAPAASPSIPILPQSPPASPPGLMNTVPLVPVSPNAAPSPAIPKAPTIDIVQILSGLTLFAPQDSAFSKLKPGFLNSLTDRQKVELLQFHTLSSFISISNFDTLTNPVQTQAGDDPKRLQLNVTTYGGAQVSMTTGAVNATVTGTVYTDNKLAIYEVDKVLLPLDVVLPKPKAPSPSPSPSKSDGKKKSSPDKSGDGNKNTNDDDDGAVPVDSSEGSDSLLWVEAWYENDFSRCKLMTEGRIP